MRWNEIIDETVIKLGKTTPDPNSPSMQFLDAFNDLSQESPFNHRQRVLGGAKIELRPQGNSTIHIGDIQGSGNGTGTKAMKTLCQLADRFDVTIKLCAYGYQDVSTEKLVDWYKGLGFSVTGDEDDPDGVDMMRDPR